jgi:hypothetical protein
MNNKGNSLPNSPAYCSEREKLPTELRHDYDELVGMYRFYATVHHSKPFVSYRILADLIREGWRLSGERMGKP